MLLIESRHLAELNVTYSFLRGVRLHKVSPLLILMLFLACHVLGDSCLASSKRIETLVSNILERQCGEVFRTGSGSPLKLLPMDRDSRVLVTDLVGDRPADHELRAARYLAHFLGHSTSVVLSTRFHGMDNPAFDGVLINQYREPVANVQIKSINSFKSLSSWRRTLNRVAQKALSFGDPKSWLMHWKIAKEDSLYVQRNVSSPERSYIRDIWRLFGVDNTMGRGTILVFDLTSLSSVGIGYEPKGVSLNESRRSRLFVHEDRYKIYSLQSPLTIEANDLDLLSIPPVTSVIFLTQRQALEFKLDTHGKTTSGLYRF